MVGKMFSRVLERFGYRKFYEPYDQRWTRATLDIDDTPLEQPYRQHAWIYACIRSIATRVASTPLKIYTGDNDDQREITEGRLYKIFQRPNQRWSAYHFKEAIATHLMLDGNALITLERERPEAEPLEMFVTGRERFEPVFSQKSSEVDYWKFRHTKTRAVQRLEHYQVILLPLFNPYSDFWGMGPLEAARQGAEQDWLAQLFNRAFFENGADPGGVLTVKRSSKEQREQWKKQFEDRHMGAGKAGKTLFLEGEAEYKQLALKHTDMAYLDQRKFSREEIGATFHVPPSELGLFDKVQKAIQKAVEKNYFNGTIVPILRLITDMFNAQFFTPYDERTWCAFDLSNVEALQDDADAKVDRATKFFSMGVPFNKINERLELGFEPVDGGDVGYLPIGFRPADMDFALLQPQPPAPQKALTTPCDIRDAIIEVGKTPTIARVLTPFSDLHEAYYTEWLTRTAYYERLFNGNLRNYLFQVRKFLETQIKIGGDKYGVAGIPEGFLDLPKAYDGRLGTISNKFYNGLKVDIGALIEQHINGANVPFVFEPNDPELLDFIATKKIKIVQHVNQESIREGVRKDLIESKRLNETVGELQERVYSRMQDSRTRSLTIARTETTQAANGLEYQCEQLAGVTTHQWIAALDEKTRSSHLSNMSLGPFPINSMFPNGCMYPGDINGPAAEVIQCRCTLMAVE